MSAPGTPRRPVPWALIMGGLLIGALLDDGTLAVSPVRVSLQQSSNIQLQPAAGMRWRAWLGSGDRTAKLSQNLVVMWGVPVTLDAVLLAWLVAQVVWFGRRFRRRSGGTSRASGMVPADG